LGAFAAAEVGGIDVVLLDSCGYSDTLRIKGPEVAHVGKGDFHKPKYEHLKIHLKWSEHIRGHPENECNYAIHFYPTEEFEDEYRSNKPYLHACVVLFLFLATAMTFVLYDFFVQRRQKIVMATAKHTTAVVSSLFPKSVRDRILEDAREQALHGSAPSKVSLFGALPRSQLKSFLDKGNNTDHYVYDTKPIADLFSEATIIFADISGFTAWSSTREPTQVFVLLETIYYNFDELARKRRVFKVETVGDCYVAVAGLPEPRKDHAVVMARFAKDVLIRMSSLTKKLGASLGPDCEELSIRIGVHSGPVTAGVLRGDKSRFQLFGDTVNTTSRLQTTGDCGKIHLSGETATLLTNSGKGHWIVPRQDAVEAKGKGVMKTFWLQISPPSTARSTTDASSSGNPECGEEAVGDVDMDPKLLVLVNWNTDVLAKLLQKIAWKRRAAASATPGLDETRQFHLPHQTVLEEVKEIIHLPAFDAVQLTDDDLSQQALDYDVLHQLRSFVTSSKFATAMHRQIAFRRLLI
jgi:class 3 adenylate cyclase